MQPEPSEPLLPGAGPRKGNFHSPGATTNVTRTPALAARGIDVLREREVGETLFGTSLKMITCGLGSGILATPWGAAGASLVTSYLITAAVLCLNAWTVMIIVHALDRWGGTKVYDVQKQQWLGTRRKPGYRIEDLGQLMRQAPKPLPALACLWDVTVNLSNFGALVGYMIVVGDTLPALMTSDCSLMSSRRPWVALGTCVCLPLCWADVSFLTYSSAVGVGANFFLFCILYRVFTERGSADDVCVVGLAPGALTCLSNLVFAVVMQMCIPEYYTQLRREDQAPSKFFWGALLPSFTFIFILICCFSTFGYLVYGSTVNSNVLIDFPDDQWGTASLVAIAVSCLMVYPNMLRPMVQPLLRGIDCLMNMIRRKRQEPVLDPWSPVAPFVPSDAGASPRDKAEHDPMSDVYEGRLVHTELLAPIQLDENTGAATLQVMDTLGFMKNALVFIDGETRQYGVVQEVSTAVSSVHSTRAGNIKLRPRAEPLFGRHRQNSICNWTSPKAGTKVVLDEDPVLMEGAITGERHLRLSFAHGLQTGMRVVVGEGARAEHRQITGLRTVLPEEGAKGERTHDIVMTLDQELRHNQGAHTRVVLDHGPIELAATLIVVSVMFAAFFVHDLGLVNVVNGALSVVVIIGIVPSACALKLHVHHDSTTPMPRAYRYPAVPVLNAVFCIVAGIATAFFTDNHGKDVVDSCVWPQPPSS